MSFLMSDGDSAIKLSADLEAAISRATSVQEITTLMHEAALAQGLVRQDNDPSIFIPVAQPAHSKVLRINGVEHTIHADTEDGLVTQELLKMRELFGTTVAALQTRDSAGRFVSQQAQADADRAEEELEEQDPAVRAQAELVRKALEAQGIDVDELRKFTASKQGEKFAQSWAEAGETYRTNHPDWPGGIQNQKIIGNILIENHLDDADDKVAAISQAVAFARKNNLLVVNEEVAKAKSIADAPDYETLKARVGYRGVDVTGGGFFGGR